MSTSHATAPVSSRATLGQFRRLLELQEREAVSRARMQDLIAHPESAAPALSASRTTHVLEFETVVEAATECFGDDADLAINLFEPFYRVDASLEIRHPSANLDREVSDALHAIGYPSYHDGVVVLGLKPNILLPGSGWLDGSDRGNARPETTRVVWTMSKMLDDCATPVFEKIRIRDVQNEDLAQARSRFLKLTEMGEQASFGHISRAGWLYHQTVLSWIIGIHNHEAVYFSLLRACDTACYIASYGLRKVSWAPFLRLYLNGNYPLGLNSENKMVVLCRGKG